MNPRKIYWRRKEGKVIAEGKRKNKTIYLFTLPNPEELIRRLEDINLGNPKNPKSLPIFNEEKRTKILRKIQTLDYKSKNNQKDA